VPQLVKNTVYYPLLLFHVSKNDTVSWNLGRIKEDFKALGMQANSIGAQVIFSSILPAGRRGSARNRHIESINSCFVVGAIVRVLAFTTMGHSSMTIIC